MSFYSYARMPRGPLPRGYLDVVPELVFEVRSPTDRWSKMLVKVSEYLEAGVTVVCLVDEGTENVHVFARMDQSKSYKVTMSFLYRTSSATSMWKCGVSLNEQAGGRYFVFWF